MVVTKEMLEEEIERNKALVSSHDRAFGVSAIRSEIKLAEKALALGVVERMAFAHDLLVRNQPIPTVEKERE